MQPTEFLRAILPDTGHYAVVSIKNKKVHQHLSPDIQDLVELSAAAVDRGFDSYFGCASFKTDKNRKKENVQAVKAFWIDLDCGTGTAYAEKQAGFDAIKALNKITKLPRPWVVDSGRGLHVYWPLAEAIEVSVWQGYAEKIIELCAKQGLKIKDPGCSTDAARILRVPGTTNYKDKTNPVPVTILNTGTVSEWPVLQKAIETACEAVGINGFESKHPIVKRRPMDAMTSRLAGNTISNFGRIMSLKTQGCAQLNWVFHNQQEVGEPLWRAALSIAQVCEDRDTAIHKLSSSYVGYSPKETEQKANGTGGPMSCAEFAKAGGAERCAECLHKGIMKGPIGLGRVLAVAPEPEEIRIVDDDIESDAEDDVKGLVVLKDVPPEKLRPKLPYPYQRGINGGIYAPGPKGPDGEGGDPDLIYEYNLDIVRRVQDPERGECLIAHLELPLDGLKEFVIPLAEAQSVDTLKARLAHNSVLGHKKQMEKVSTYVIQAVKNLQATMPAEPACTQMGWAEDRQSFVWGRTRFTKQGSFYCPPAAKASSVADMMKTAGTYDEWESIAERYAAPGMEMYACCVLLAFGSLLTTYTLEDPIWLHMVSTESGTGKTTLTKVINSIFGNPHSMMLRVNDTVNSVEKRRVVFNSIAICQDEITNMPPDKLSQIAYSQSQQREKLRLNSAAQEVSNLDKRENIFFSNGNKHVSEALSILKTNAAGEFARLIEIQFARLNTVVGGKDHFGKIMHNYGHAGSMYAPWLVQNECELSQRTQEAQTRFSRDFKSQTSERNWVAATGAAFAACDIIQQELGILKKYDRSRLYDVWGEHMQSMRAGVDERVVSHDHLLGDFLNENYTNIIVPDSTAQKITDAATASLYGRKQERDARNRLVIRWEKDTQLLFISQSELKAYCGRRMHSFVDLVNHYHTTKQFQGIVDKRMGSGTGIVSSPIKTLAFKVVGGELGMALKDL